MTRWHAEHSSTSSEPLKWSASALAAEPTLKREAPDLPVVLISTHDIDVIKLEKEAARADMILSKPYLISEIVDVIHRFL